jgi:hypothetical protein
VTSFEPQSDVASSEKQTSSRRRRTTPDVLKPFLNKNMACGCGTRDDSKDEVLKLKRAPIKKSLRQQNGVRYAALFTPKVKMNVKS